MQIVCYAFTHTGFDVEMFTKSLLGTRYIKNHGQKYHDKMYRRQNVARILPQGI
jgi:hypothetical protein